MSVVSLALVALATFVVLAHALVAPVPTSQERACSTDGGCALVPWGCCGTTLCNYVAVNTDVVTKYTELNAAENNCTGPVACPAIATLGCNTSAYCVDKDPSTGLGQCTQGSSGVVIIDPPITKSCQVVCGSCTAWSSGLAAICLQPTPTCQSECIEQFATCKEVTLPTGVTSSELECAYTGGAKAEQYAACLNNCGSTIATESNCTGLPCGDCVAKAGCSFCNAIGACVGSKGSSACLQLTPSGLVTSAASCPSSGNPTETGVVSEAADPTPFQANLDLTPSTIKEKFAIIITMVVNSTSTKSDVNNIVKLFVDLIGAGTPSQADKDEICAVLKGAVTKLDERIPSAALTCQLDARTTVKRDAQMVATLSYPTSNNIQGGSASALGASFALALAALVALF